MLWIPQKGLLRVATNVASGAAATPGTAVTTDTVSASTKGSPAELIASLGFDCYLMHIMTYNYGANATQARLCLDILVGSSGNEDVLIGDLLGGHSHSISGGGRNWWFPVYVPAGTRISARVAGDRLNVAAQVMIWCYGGHGTPPFRVGSKVTTYGIGTVPAATSVNPGNPGTWTQITSSTSADHFYLTSSVQFVDASQAAGHYNLDIGRGASTAEDLINGVGILRWQPNSNEVMSEQNPFNNMRFCDIPSGTRLVARINSAATEDQDVALHGVT